MKYEAFENLPESARPVLGITIGRKFGHVVWGVKDYRQDIPDLEVMHEKVRVVFGSERGYPSKNSVLRLSNFGSGSAKRVLPETAQRIYDVIRDHINEHSPVRAVA